MKVLIINTLYHPNVLGGAERSVQFLAEGLVHAGHEAVVVSAVPGDGVSVSWVNGVKIYYVGLRNVYWPFNRVGRQGVRKILLKPLWHLIDTYNPVMAREVEKIITQEQPDLVHTNNLSCFSVAVWRIIKTKKLPLVHTIRDYYLLCPKSTMFSRGRNCEEQCTLCRLYSLPRRKYSDFVDIAVGISRFILEKHVSLGFFLHARAEVIFNAYEPEDFDFQPSINRQPCIRFGYIGRLHPTKGINVVLRAIQMLPKESWSLSIAGQGSSSYEKYLKGNSLESIQFLGFIRPEEFFSKIDILIVPSIWHEPLGRTVLEAYAHGIPVIGSRRGGIPELVEEGKTGLLFDPDHPEELSAVMNTFIQRPELLDVMRVHCLEKAREFAPKRIVGQYVKVYESAIAGNCRLWTVESHARLCSKVEGFCKRGKKL
jgi:glycosyltransferase involved in cell wall biosynthesis